MLRICLDCLLAKPPDAFYANPSRTDRLQTRCKLCYVERQKAIYQANRAKYQAASLQRYHFLKTTNPAKISRSRKPKKPRVVVPLDPRTCTVCTISFERRPQESRKDFLQRKTCTVECQRFSRHKPQPLMHQCAYSMCHKFFIEGKLTTPYCSRRCARHASVQDILALGQQTCYRCNLLQPLRNFDRSKKHATGYETRCKTCRAKQHKDFWAKHPGYHLRYYNSDKARKMYTKERKLYRRKHYLKHKDKNTVNHRLWRQTHPEQVARQKLLKRARKMGASVLEQVDRRAIYQRDKWICQLCFKKVRPREASLDHVIPLSKGGAHSARNLVLAHIACNSQKGNRAIAQQMRLFG